MPPSTPPPTPPDENKRRPTRDGHDARGGRRGDDDQLKIRAARSIFTGALERGGGRDHRRVREWLESRGLKIEWFPGGCVPRSLLFSPACQDYSHELRQTGQFPAMVARCESCREEPSEITLVHRTFLDDDRAAKRAYSAEWGDARKHRGVHNGHVIWLSPRRVDEFADYASGVGELAAVREHGPYPYGILCAGEGIETSAAVLVSACLATVSCLDANGLRAAAFDAELFNPYTPDGFLKKPGWWVHTIVLCGDLDARREGQEAVLDAYQRLTADHPRLTVRSFLPAASLPGGLVEVAGSGEIRECPQCKGSKVGWRNAPCFRCSGRGELGFRRGEDRPRLDVEGYPIKSVDWNDVLRIDIPGVATGRDIIRSAMDACVTAGYASFDDAVRAAARKSEQWTPEAVVAPSGRVVAPVSSASDAVSRTGGGVTPREAPALEKEGGGEGAGGAASSGGGGWWDGSCGGILSWYEGQSGPVIAPGPLERARAFLILRCKPGKDMRRFRLLNWGGQFWWFDDVAWRKIDETQLSGMVHDWLNGFWHLKRWKSKDLPEIVRINPKAKDVAEVMKCLAQETFAAINEMPAFLPPSLDESGNPTWGQAVLTWLTQRGGRSVVRHQLGQARDYIVFENGLLDRRALISERQVRLLPATSDLFTQAVHPYPLAIFELQSLLDGGPGGAGLRPAIMNRLCPAWWQGLQDATSDSPDREQAVRQRGLGLMFGDTIGADRRIEKIHLVLGPQRAFKGCVEEAVKAMVGDDNVAMTSFFDLGGDRFALAPLVGRNVAIMSDAHIGQMMDSTLAVERLKTIRGNGSVAVRDLYQAAKPNVRLKIRFWIFCNDEPDKLQDNSGAMAGSFVIWPATVSFFGREDPRVKERIALEGPGIAVWALYWHAELFATERPKIEMDELGKAIAEELADSGSNMRQFLKECCVCDPELGIPKFDPNPDTYVWYRDVGGHPGLYDVYVRWCQRHEKKPVAHNKMVGKIRPIVAGVGALRQKRLGTESVDDGDPRKNVLYGLLIRPNLDAGLRFGAVTSGTGGFGKTTPVGVAREYTSRELPDLYSPDTDVPPA